MKTISWQGTTKLCESLDTGDPSSWSKCLVVDEKYTLSALSGSHCSFFLMWRHSQGRMACGAHPLGSRMCFSLLKVISDWTAHTRLMCWCTHHVWERAPRPPAWGPSPPEGSLEECVKGRLGFSAHLLSQTRPPGLLGLTRPRTEAQGSRAWDPWFPENPPLIQAALALLPTPQSCAHHVLSSGLTSSHPSLSFQV